MSEVVVYIVIVIIANFAICIEMQVLDPLLMKNININQHTGACKGRCIARLCVKSIFYRKKHNGMAQ